MTKAEMTADARWIFDALDCSPAAFSEATKRAVLNKLAELEIALKSDHPIPDLALTKERVAKVKPVSSRSARNLQGAKDAAYGLYMVLSMRVDEIGERS